MELYALVNTSTNKIEVGPRDWKVSFWARFLNEQNVEFNDFPREAPATKLDISGSNYSIVPVDLIDPPTMDDFYQQPSGPFYTINPNIIHGHYNIGEKPVDQIGYKLKQDITSVRFNKEIAGTEYNGMMITTDRQSQSLITGARVKSDNDNSKTINWKATNGWVTLDRAAIIAISDVVFDYVETCFDTEKQLHEAVDAAITNNTGDYAATITALKAIDIEGTFEAM